MHGQIATRAGELSQRITTARVGGRSSDRNPLDLVERDLILILKLAAQIESRGTATGKGQDVVCTAAKQDANQSVPRGCYKRHYQCDCE